MPEPEVQAPPVVETPNPVQQLAVEAAIEAGNSESEDAVLDRLFGNDKPAPQQAARTTELSAPDPDFDRALKALQRDGVPADIIDSIRTNPSKMKEWGLKAAKRQADVDAFGAKKAKADDAPNSSTGNNAKSPKNSAQSDDGEADADPLSVFGEIFGDDAAKPLRQITDRIRADFEQKSRDMEVRYETRSAYERLSQAYGDDSPSLDEITQVAAQIGRERPGQFDSVSEIVREAFRMRMGEPKKADPRNSARPTVGRPPARPVREIDREDAVLDVLLSGGTRADAFRAITR